MIGYSLSHWGIFTIPDDATRQNIQFNQDGTVEMLDRDRPLVIQSIVQPVRQYRPWVLGEYWNGEMLH